MVLSLAVGVTGCDSANSATGPGIAFQGTFALETIRGEPLPASFSGGTFMTVADTLVFLPGLPFWHQRVERRSTGGVGTDISHASQAQVYFVTGPGAFEFQPPPCPSAALNAETDCIFWYVKGTIDGDVLTLAYHNAPSIGTWVYRRVH